MRATSMRRLAVSGKRATPMSRLPVAVLASLAFVASGCGEQDESEAGTSRSAPTLTVAAASDLRPAFTDLGKRFEQRTGTNVIFSFGSSGQLAQQIEQGAPFDLFASASADYVDDVIEAGRGDAATKATYAFGRLVVWSADSKRTLSDLSDPDIRNVAIANPEHAPYGRAAHQALQRSGELPGVEPKLVLGENVSDTLRLAQSGNADAAIVALSLALATDGQYTRIPERLHKPLEQALVVTGEGEQAATAKRFAAFLDSEAGRQLMRRYGFLLPGERLSE